MQKGTRIKLHSDGKEVELAVSSILYIHVVDRVAEIHLSSGEVCRTRLPMSRLEPMLGEGFLCPHRGLLVSVMAIHKIDDRIYLNNGEALTYTAARKKRRLREALHAAQKRYLEAIPQDGIPTTWEEYRDHYRSFDTMPFAFTDIELVFNEERQAVDWIFCYGNPALAELERTALERLIGSTFSSIFANMDDKWLKSYERAALYGETLEMLDHSPEINRDLMILCFPTFKGHCGCILVDLEKISFASTTGSSDALFRFLGRQFGKR